MEYSITFNTFGNPSISFLNKEELSSNTFDLMEGEYDFKDFTAEIELDQYQTFLQQLNGTSDIIINAINTYYGDTNNSLSFKTRDVIAVNDEILINDEIVKITSISGSGITQKAIAERAKYNTRKTGHNLLDNTILSATIDGRYSPVGLEGELSDENGDLIGTVYLTDFKSNGSSIILNFQNILNKFDKDFYVNKDDIDLEIYPSVNIALKKIYNDIMETTPAFDELVNGIRFAETEDSFIVINAMEALKTLLTLTGAYLSYIPASNKYQVKTLLGLSVFDETPVSSTNAYNKVTLEGGGYESTVKNLATNIKITYNRLDKYWDSEYSDLFRVEGEQKGIIRGLNYSIQAYTSGASLEAVSDVKEVDLSDYLVEFDFPFSKIARRYMYVFGLILGHLKLNTIPDHGFEEGKYYDIEGLTSSREIVTFIDDSKDYILFCYAQDSKMARFIILNVAAYQPISAAIIVKTNSQSQAEFELDVKDFLYTSGDDIETAEHIDYGYKFFEAGQAIQLRETSSYDLLANGTIDSISGNIINLTASILPFPSASKVIITYGAKTGTPSDIQNKHLFVDSGVL